MILKTELYPHQKAAVEKLLPLKVGALYMEMGTGKTRTVLELIQRRLELNKLYKVLWLCPCSVKQNLYNDILYHCDEVPNLIEISGIESLSASDREYSRLLKYVDDTTMIVVDESNLVKNPNAKRTQRITSLAEHCKYRVILNGTPISRNEADLFAQWFILDWRILGYKSYYSFAANHLQMDDKIPGKIVRTLNTDYLTRRISPYTYQVLKKDCLQLPSKYYHSHLVYLTPEQGEEYDRVINYMFDKLDDYIPETMYRLFSALQAVISGNYVDNLDKHMTTRSMYEPEEHPRIKRLVQIIETEKITDKAIIFCKYTQEIHDIVHMLNKIYGDGSAVEFTGNLSQKKRQENILSFKNKSRFFVANKTCAGYGLNLQFCNVAIFYSNDWNFATRMQSEDRIHRIGQTEIVKIHDIICTPSLDERIWRCLCRKENLVDAFKSKINEYKNKKEELKIWLNGGKTTA